MSSIPSATPDLSARLVCRIRSGHTERFAVPKSEVLVGREPGLPVTIPVDGVSRRHARITFDGKSYAIENLSPAGTFLNGALVVRERLAHLDVITLGKKVDLLFLLRVEGESSVTVEGIVRAALVPQAGDGVPYEIAPGEILMGRSSANNVVAESSGAVSKIHARIERSPQQLVLRDLGSSNGTFVNGERVMTALLRDGDEIALANVVHYRVVIERGRVTAPPAAAPGGKPAPEDDTRLQFSPEWKTRYDWDTSEIKDIAALQARLIAEDGERMRARAKKDAPPAKKDAPARKEAPAKPTPPAVSRTGKTEKVPVVTLPAAGDTPLSGQAEDASAAKAAADALAAQGAPVPAAVTPAPAAVKAVSEIRLTGPAGDLVVRDPGEYSLGRAKDAPLRVDNPTVSRRHAVIVLTPDRQAFVGDGGGANGTLRNGTPVTARAPLADGDLIRVGEVELRVKLVTGG